MIMIMIDQVDQVDQGEWGRMQKLTSLMRAAKWGWGWAPAWNLPQNLSVWYFHQGDCSYFHQGDDFRQGDGNYFHQGGGNYYPWVDADADVGNIGSHLSLVEAHEPAEIGLDEASVKLDICRFN